LIKDTPLVILTNANTASAAEILAGSIQDLDLGLVVGDSGGKTFGKGLVQNVEELPGKTALKFTVAKYYTPSGRCIQSTNYEGADGTGKSIEENEQKTFTTNSGRVVKDGGGIAAGERAKRASLEAEECED